MTAEDFPDHLQYAVDVVDGQVPACTWVRRACERSLRDHEDALMDPDYPFVYSPIHAEKFLKFARACPHIEGAWARKGMLFEPEPWQVYFFGEVYGWRVRGAEFQRRFKEVLLEIARKNGKSFKGGIIGLYEFLYGDAGAQVYSIATKDEQAKITWKVAAKLAGEMGIPGIRITGTEMTHKNGVFRTLAKVQKKITSDDGLNPSLTIVDEAAAILNRAVIEVMTSAEMARESAWVLYLTTAQASVSTAYYEKRTYLQDVLKGRIDDPRIFGLVYALDSDADWRNPELWCHANPNLGVSVYPQVLADKVKQAEKVKGQQPEIKRKNFNIWTSADEAWLDPGLWEAAPAGVRREGMCAIGVDLSMTTNLTAVTTLFKSLGRYYADFKCWFPADSYDELPGTLKPIYDAAVEDGILTMTPGPAVRYEYVKAYIVGQCEAYEVVSVAADPYNAQRFVNELEDEGIPVLTVSQNIAKLNAPTKEVEVAILEKKIAHDHNPFIAWQLEGCNAYYDANRNIKIKRGQNKYHAIDNWTALLNAWAAMDEGMDITALSFSFRPIK